jgi:hypothetical protein
MQPNTQTTNTQQRRRLLLCVKTGHRQQTAWWQQRDTGRGCIGAGGWPGWGVQVSKGPLPELAGIAPCQTRQGLRHALPEDRKPANRRVGRLARGGGVQVSSQRGWQAATWHLCTDGWSRSTAGLRRTAMRPQETAPITRMPLLCQPQQQQPTQQRFPAPPLCKPRVRAQSGFWVLPWAQNPRHRGPKPCTCMQGRCIRVRFATHTLCKDMTVLRTYKTHRHAHPMPNDSTTH